ncbi:hypothetical protein FACS18949_07800 [Clostridia bacterium]|nr:hypothetical protein FACS18949_07800 [Clostridia bacterium]
MRLTKRETNTILITLGLGIFAAGYFLVYSDFTKQTQAVQDEIAILAPRSAELEAHVSRIPLYNMGIEAFAEAAKENLSWFPPSVRTEDWIMYSVGLETDTDMEISSASFSDPAELASFTAKTEVGGSASLYRAYGTTLNITNRLSYSDLKKTLDLITSNPERTALESVSVSYDASGGILSGTMTISKTFVDNGSYVYTPTDVPYGSVGVDSPFGAAAASPNAEEGEAVEQNE